MFGSITSIISAIRLFWTIYQEFKSLLKELDQKKAAEKRERLQRALVMAEKAKTDEEKRRVINDIIGNSF